MMRHTLPNDGNISWLGLLALVVGLVGLFALVTRFLFAKIAFLICGWKRVTLRYPTRHIKETGEVYTRRTGAVGPLQSLRGFDVQLALDGLAVTPGFARHDPAFIPWADVRRVEVVDTTIDIKIDYQKSMWFRLPHDALEIIKARAPFVSVVEVT